MFKIPPVVTSTPNIMNGPICRNIARPLMTACYVVPDTCRAIGEIHVADECRSRGKFRTEIRSLKEKNCRYLLELQEKRPVSDDMK